MIRRKLPPYAVELAQGLRGDLRPFWGTSPDGAQPCINLLVGSEAWMLAKRWRERRLLTLLPPNEDPAGFDWSVLAVASPLLLWRAGSVEGEDVHALVRQVMTDGVAVVLDAGTLARYVAEVAA